MFFMLFFHSSTVFGLAIAQFEEKIYVELAKIFTEFVRVQSKVERDFCLFTTIFVVVCTNLTCSLWKTFTENLYQRRWRNYVERIFEAFRWFHQNLTICFQNLPLFVTLLDSSQHKQASPRNRSPWNLSRMFFELEKKKFIFHLCF